MELRFLGPFRLTVRGRRVAAMRPRCCAVLAFLALAANRAVSIERIIDAVWGDAPPATARTQVHVDISTIRRVVRAAGGPDPVATSAAGYLLNVAPGWLDIDDFANKVSRARRAIVSTDLDSASGLFVEALSLWRGTAFADVNGAFVQAARARLDEQRLAVVESLAELRLATGDDEAVIDSLRVLIDEHPLRERPRTLMMLALYRKGRRSQALQVARDLRRVLAEEEGLDPGPEINDVERRILRDDPSLLPSRPSGEQLPSDRYGTTRPAQLPSSVAWFTGREDRLSQLDTAIGEGIDGESGRIIAITGLAGVGKTSLVTQWTHRVRDRFPDGQLFVDLRGYADMPAVRPIDALAGFLRALGVPQDRVPDDLDEAAALYRSTLDDHQILVVLDNARDANHIRHLLPGSPGCLVVVTSRDQLVGLTAREGAVHLALDCLTPPQSHNLLARMLGKTRVGAEPRAAADIAELCGHLPLALRIAAAVLIARPEDTLATYAENLRSTDRLGALEIAGDPAATVRLAFESSYTALPAEAQRVFRLLGIAPRPTFTAAAIAALADITPAQASCLLNQLARANIIDRRPGDRFNLHDLVRQYATTRANADEPQSNHNAAIKRLQQFYLSSVDAPPPW